MTALAHALAPQETVVFYPSFGSFLGDDPREPAAWRVRVCGSVCDPCRARLRERLLARALESFLRPRPGSDDQLRFQRRVSGFKALALHGKQITITLGDDEPRLATRSKRNGHFEGDFRVPCEELPRLEQAGLVRDGWLEFSCPAPAGDGRRFTGRARLLGPTGVSVISDIDDTIKHTEVGSRGALLCNTFVRAFEPIIGMSEVYAAWRRQGAAFHYVSSSPWQLYDHLAEWLAGVGYPEGTFHLHPFRLRDHMLRKLLFFRRPYKCWAMRQLFRAFPQRQFVLVGDSGEKDPEIYAWLWRQFPEQTRAIYIRETERRPMTTRRREKVFGRLPGDVWRVYRLAGDLPWELPRRHETAVDS